MTVLKGFNYVRDFNCQTTFSKIIVSILKIKRPWYNVFDFKIYFKLNIIIVILE